MYGVCHGDNSPPGPVVRTGTVVSVTDPVTIRACRRLSSPRRLWGPACSSRLPRRHRRRRPAPAFRSSWRPRRAAIITNVRYELSLAVPREQTQPLTGTMTARFQLSDASQPLVFDFAPGADKVRRVAVGGMTVSHAYVTDHIVVPAAALTAGATEIRIEFTAGDASLNRNPDFLYALFVPARAHLAIPVFDQPDLKARWTLKLTYPGEWVAVSNGAPSQAGQIAFWDGAGGQRQRRHGHVRRNRAPLHLSLLLRRRRLQGRDRRAQRPHLPHVPSRDRRRQGGTQQGRDLRSPCQGACLHGGLHRPPLRLWQVRFRRHSVLPVRRHGARRQGALQRLEPVARRIRHPEPVSWAAPRSSRTRRRTCGSAISSPCAGSTTCG